MDGTESVVDGHKSQMGLSVELYSRAADDGHGPELWPAYFCQILNSRFTERGNIELTAGRDQGDTTRGWTPSFGNVIRGCQIMDVRRLPDNQYWELYEQNFDPQSRNFPVMPAVRFLERFAYGPNPPRPAGMAPSFEFSVIEHNYLRRDAVGVFVEPSAENTLIRANRIEEVETSVYDKGVGTVFQPWTPPFPR
jgi:hypothetical protein